MLGAWRAGRKVAMLRKLLITFAGLTAVLIVAGAAVLWLIRPTESLNMDYNEISVRAKINDMISRRKLSLVLYEEDINNLLKKSISGRPEIAPNIRTTGAAFHLRDDRLTAVLNLNWRGLVPFEAVVEYRLQWRDPVVTLEPEAVRVKRFSVPGSLFPVPQETIRINDLLPSLVAVKDVRFQGQTAAVDLKLRR